MAAQGPESSSGRPHRLLVVANETVTGRKLMDEIRERCGSGDAEVHVVTPALQESRLDHAMGDVDEALHAASARLQASLNHLGESGISAEGEPGDSDPVTAATDTLARWEADEILISTHPAERSSWLERGVVERMREAVEMPVTHVVVDIEQGTVGEAEHFAPQHTEVPDDDRSNLARLLDMPWQERAALVLALVVPIILVLLAASCAVGEDTIDGTCAARVLIAAAASIIGIWHAVALVLFESAGNRGTAARVVANTIVYGFPALLVISLIL
ncbi:MAG: hypothetical protein ACR2NA_08990 [Solirubrobacterales bacterium]